MQQSLKESALLRSVADLFADFSDLVQKEFQLARAELADNIKAQMRAPVWMAVAAVLALFAGFALVEAAILGLASTGLALPWSCLIVGGVLAAVAVVAFAAGRAGAAKARLAPQRSARQLNENLKSVKEQIR